MANKALEDFLHQHGGLKKRLLPSDLTLMMTSLSTKKELERAQGVADEAKKLADELKAAIGEKQKTLDCLEKQVWAVGIFSRDEATLSEGVFVRPSVGR